MGLNNMVTKKVLEEELRYEREMKNNFRDIIREQNLKLHDKGNEIESLKAQIEELKEEFNTARIEHRDTLTELVEECSKANAYRDALKIVASGGE